MCISALGPSRGLAVMRAVRGSDLSVHRVAVLAIHPFTIAWGLLLSAENADLGFVLDVRKAKQG